ncbi:MAG TPA: hypothetical protein VGC91_07885 [Pyrinomonadaceae bacterium]|jgi:hypothetical protein
MIPIFQIPDQSFERARRLRPRITALGACSYELVSPLSGRTYRLKLDDEWQPRAFSCSCPACSYCWHAAAVLDEVMRLSLAFGDHVLVNELYGQVWHTVLYASDEPAIFTAEIPEGFSLAFVVEVERLVAARRAC